LKDKITQDSAMITRVPVLPDLAIILKDKITQGSSRNSHDHLGSFHGVSCQILKDSVAQDSSRNSRAGKFIQESRGNSRYPFTFFFLSGNCANFYLTGAVTYDRQNVKTYTSKNNT
jgi:hypothetical protein